MPQRDADGERLVLADPHDLADHAGAVDERVGVDGPQALVECRQGEHGGERAEVVNGPQGGVLRDGDVEDRLGVEQAALGGGELPGGLAQGRNLLTGGRHIGLSGLRPLGAGHDREVRVPLLAGGRTRDVVLLDPLQRGTSGGVDAPGLGVHPRRRLLGDANDVHQILAGHGLIGEVADGMALRDNLLELHHALLPDAGAPGGDNIRSAPGIPGVVCGWGFWGWWWLWVWR